jgi:ABC-type branched-subunit amino acid transport system substrate-binding protein
VGLPLRSLIGALSAAGLLVSACAPAPAATPTSAPAAAPTTAPAAKPTTPPAAPTPAPQATTAPTTAVAAKPTTAAAAAAPTSATKPAQLSADFTLDLRYGVLAGLTGDGAAFGQPWNQAANLAVDYINQSLKDVGLSEKFKLTMVGAQDTGGNAQRASKQPRSWSASTARASSSATSSAPVPPRSPRR